MSGGRSWQGDWEKRLYERTRERGFATVTAFATQRPLRSTLDLAQELAGEAGDLNAVQVFRGLLGEAEESNKVQRLMRDLLARALAEAFPGGWPEVLDDKNRFAFASAIGSWVACTPDARQDEAEEVGRKLMASPPPTGWRPLGPDDQQLLALLPDGPS